MCKLVLKTNMKVFPKIRLKYDTLGSASGKTLLGLSS